MGPSSWANDMEAKACAKICSHLISITRGKSIAVITRFSAQKLTIRTYLQRMGHADIKVMVVGLVICLHYTCNLKLYLAYYEKILSFEKEPKDLKQDHYWLPRTLF